MLKMLRSVPEPRKPMTLYIRRRIPEQRKYFQTQLAHKLNPLIYISLILLIRLM